MRLSDYPTQRAGEEIGGNVGVLVLRLVENIRRSTSLTEQWVLGKCSNILLFQSALLQHLTERRRAHAD